jgi:hypothetical protein
MATRNLAHTIIEGGRHRQSQKDRVFRNRRLRRARYDEEGNVVGREAHPVGQCLYHHDRLAPLWRWLRSHLGRPWTKVFQELCREADRRTMKGRHLRDHVLLEVEKNWQGRRYRGFYVDGHGRLREDPRRDWCRQEGAAESFRESAEALAWTAGRRVIVRGESLYWTAEPVMTDPTRPAFSRQGPPLSRKETIYWTSLSAATQEALGYRPARLARRERRRFKS